MKKNKQDSESKYDDPTKPLLVILGFMTLMIAAGIFFNFKTFVVDPGQLAVVYYSASSPEVKREPGMYFRPSLNRVSFYEKAAPFKEELVSCRLQDANRAYAEVSGQFIFTYKDEQLLDIDRVFRGNQQKLIDTAIASLKLSFMVSCVGILTKEATPDILTKKLEKQFDDRFGEIGLKVTNLAIYRVSFEK